VEKLQNYAWHHPGVARCTDTPCHYRSIARSTVEENIMRAGKDFPDIFTADNYTLRHATGHNMRDPESLITGREIARGLNYDNSHREYDNEGVYLSACSGEERSEFIELCNPRVFN
jgi:hypothetical protein